MNNTTKTIIGAIVVVLIIWAGYSYITPKQSTLNEPIKVGAILSLTGKTAQTGEYMKNGIELAKDVVNLNGGVNGRMIEIIYADSEANPAKGISGYNDLVSIRGAKVVLAGVSGVVLGIAPLAEKDKVLAFSIGAAAPKISEAGDYVFRNNLLPQTEAENLVEMIYNKRGYREIGALFVNAAAGVGYRDHFQKVLAEKGGEIGYLEMYEKGTTDFRSQLLKIKQSAPEAVFAGAYPEELALILKQAKELGVETEWFTFYGAQDPKVIEVAGNASEGLIYFHFFDPRSSDPLVVEFQKMYEQKYGTKSESYSALAYDNVLVLAEVMEKCSDPEDTTCLKDEMYKLKDFKGITGSINFDENGDTHKGVLAKTIKNGEFVKYEE